MLVHERLAIVGVGECWATVKRIWRREVLKRLAVEAGRRVLGRKVLLEGVSDQTLVIVKSVEFASESR